MKKPTFTKGPWAVGAPDGTGEADSGKQYNGKPYKEHCRVEARNRQGFINGVCHIYQGEGGVGSPQALSGQRANARLIAAAPELFEQCKFLEEMLTGIDHPSSPKLAELRDILAKAEGEK
jgi:hypothetical protein